MTRVLNTFVNVRFSELPTLLGLVLRFERHTELFHLIQRGSANRMTRQQVPEMAHRIDSQADGTARVIRVRRRS